MSRLGGLPGRRPAGGGGRPATPEGQAGTGAALFLVLLAPLTLGLPPTTAPAAATGDSPGAPGPAAGACSPQPYPLAFTDDLGRTVVLPAPPRRIVALGPSLTETVFAVGAGGQVAGADRHGDYPPATAALPRVGSLPEPHFERIVALARDLVLLAGLDRGHLRRLEELRLRVALFAPADLEGIHRTIRVLGAVSSHSVEARALVASMQTRVARVDARVQVVPIWERPRVFYEVGPDPLVAAGPGSYLHDLIRRAGGVNVAPNDPAPWPVFSLEALVQVAPTLIVTPFPETARALRAGRRPGWNTLPAIRNGRIYPIDPDIASRPGTRAAPALEALASAFYPGFRPGGAPEGVAP